MLFVAASFMLLYLNEYHVAQAVYTLHGDSKLWLDNITKAQVWSSFYAFSFSHMKVELESIIIRN